ncbi:ROK family transcriptional regulator [Streptomyces violens]|uniref:ROK family transcriptional regulator n=1 Tax=Streptomyces violens TaxID=66377 RepID=UPI0004C12570|nr:ROK family transcriptional regulator [Streptomyces violens]
MDIRRGLGGPGRAALPSMTLLRELTDQIVLDTVFEQAPITRAEVAQVTGISKTTVSEAVRRLEGAGLLLPAGAQTGRQGRVGTYYRVAAGAGFVLAASLDSTEVRLTAADLFGKPFHEASAPPAGSGKPADAAGQLRAMVRDAIAGSRGARGPLLAVGLSVANPVDPGTSAVIPLPETPHPAGLFQPREALAGVTDAPLLVENDVNLAALAERWHGATGEAGSCAYVHIGAGMGMGLVIGDELVRGARGLAGEIGYLGGSHGRAGGRHGFARAVAEGFATGAETGGGTGGAAADLRGPAAVEAARTILDRAAEGDAEAQAVVAREGRTIGEAVAAVCAVVDPELVLLGGPIGAHPALLEPVRATVDALAPLAPRVETGTLGENAALRGALALAVRRGRTDLWARANN